MSAAGKPDPVVRPVQSAFESTVVRLQAKPDDQGVPVEWACTNHWDFPLVVECFDLSCGCLSGRADYEAIGPGKTGKIRASFTPGAHRGLVRKSLHVRFVGHQSPVELVVEARVPHSVELSERELAWTAASLTGKRHIDITTGTGNDFTITGLSGVSENQFRIAREDLIAKRHYRLSITPAANVSPGIHTLLVRTDAADPRDRVVAVFLHVPR